MAEKKTKLVRIKDPDIIDMKKKPQLTKEQRSVTASVEASIDLAKRLLEEHDFEDDLGSVQTYIANHIIAPLPYFIANKRIPVTADDLYQAYAGFQALMEEINRYTLYVPTVTSFAKYIFVSTTTFNNWLNENSDRGDMAKMIKDYLSEPLMQNMMIGKISAIPSIFVAKANFGMKDNENQQVNILNVNAETKSLSEIMEEYARNK